LVAIGFLIILEGLLSFDNALALAAMVKHLPHNQQKKALTYGIFGAYGFRFTALAFLTYLMRSYWVKFLGGGYLIWMAMHHFFGPPEEDESKTDAQALSRKFWKMVVFVELTDITFSMDSILASVAVSKKFWVVFTGGVLGITMMRFVSGLFIRAIEVFPKLERSAYLLVLIVGLKMVMEGAKIQGANFESSAHLSFWVFWGGMALALLSGFTEKVQACTTDQVKGIV
jgi:YkoY family integral membrane protein